MAEKNVSQLVSMVQKALFDFRMVRPGDRMLVGVSGGKDSMALLHALSLLRKYHPARFELTAASVRMGFETHQYEEAAELCGSLGVPHHLLDAGLGASVFHPGDGSPGGLQSSPCALCARVRRAALAGFAARTGCRTLALGHNRDDAVETLFMRLTREGRFGSFSPVTALTRAGIDQIRPLLYVPVRLVAEYCRDHALSVRPSECPAAGKTARAAAAAELDALAAGIPDIRAKLFGALLRDGRDGWMADGD